MAPQDIISAFYVAFLFIFFLTVLVVIGVIIKIGPFKNINASYTKWLVGIFIIELAGIFILTYKDSFKPTKKIIQPYKLAIHYRDCIKDYRESLDFDQRNCLNMYYDVGEDIIPGEEKCNDVINEYKKLKEIANEFGRGDIYLDVRSERKGDAIYIFPGENSKIALEINVKKDKERDIQLEFKQPKRVVVRDGKETIRPGYKFTIKFKHDEKYPNKYRGELFHPKHKIKGKSLKLADAELIQINN
jgi:hypothetical protein